MKNKLDYDILVTTGCGNTIQGGADIWSNYFISNIYPIISKNRNYVILVDSKRPTDWDSSYFDDIPNLSITFFGDSTKKTYNLLEKCNKIHFLHPNYHKREHLWKFKEKFETIFVHAYPQDMKNVLVKLPDLDRLQLGTKVDEVWYDEFLKLFKKVIWIGNNPTNLKYTHNITNFYEFKVNNPLSPAYHKVGFTARAETRKCIHWLNNHKGFALTNIYDIQNLKDISPFQLKKIKIYQWKPEFLHKFMLKKWDIFHGAHFKEPFGYNIFQAVDYGKLPIINKDWCTELNYKYRASTSVEFDKCVKLIINDTYTERLYEFEKIKKHLLQFDNKEKWISQVLEIFRDL